VRGDYPRARRALCEAADIFEQLGDRSGAAWSISQQGDIARAICDLPAARALYESALAAFRAAGDQWGTARSLTDLAHIDGEQGAHAAARAGYREALEIFAALGHRRGVARALEGYACLALAEGHASRSLKLAAAAAHLRRLISAPLHVADQSRLDRKLLPAWNSLSEFEGKQAWAEGSAMSLEEAMRYSLGERASVTSG
jgi:tetratricopeptide (TPR) repeat protein